MKSDVIRVKSSGEGIEDVLKQADAIAQYKGMSSTDAIHLRLLMEEMMGMVRAIAGDVSADFWVEETDGKYELHLSAKTMVTKEKREKLLSISTSGKNMAAKGFMGKMGDLFAQMVEPVNENIPGYFIQGWEYGGMSDPEFHLIENDVWSFNRYKASLEEDQDKKEEVWDELEKSIVANVADEIEIAIRAGAIEMIVYKKF